MKKQILILCLLSMSVGVFAQRAVVNNLTTYDDKRLHFGFSLGINAMDFGLEHYTPIGAGRYQYDPAAWSDDKVQVEPTDTVRADVSSLVPGFSVAIISSLRLTNLFELRFLPGISFGERRLVYNVPVIDANENTYGEGGQPYYSTKSTYLDFPLLVKYKAKRINNQRPYLLGGASYRYDISKTGEQDLVRLKRGGFYAEVGVGWDSYLQFFRFSTELKFSLGLTNIIDDAPDATQRQYYSDAFKRLTSNIFTLSFHFE